jgi:hypothetical protein
MTAPETGTLQGWRGVMGLICYDCVTWMCVWQYIARQRRENEAARERLKNKFGGTRMQVGHYYL